MKKLMTLMMFGAVAALSACETVGSNTDYSYETQAPYADERTVGMEEKHQEVMQPKKAEQVFESRQHK